MVQTSLLWVRAGGAGRTPPGLLALKSEHCCDTRLEYLGKRNQYMVTTLNVVQCRMARTALGWGVRDLAVAAKVSPDTVSRLERGETLREDTIAAIRRALEKAGVKFIEQNGGGPGVRLKKKGKRK